jgi:hypothetical protein
MAAKKLAEQRSERGYCETSSLISRVVGLSDVTGVATAAPVGGFSLLAMLIYVADEHPAFEAGARTLEASVVHFYGVVLLLSGWARVGCARLCGVHKSFRQ